MTAITAAGLAERLPQRPGRLDAVELERWLLDAGLAQRDGDLLRPTGKAIEVAAGLLP